MDQNLIKRVKYSWLFDLQSLQTLWVLLVVFWPPSLRALTWLRGRGFVSSQLLQRQTNARRSLSWCVLCTICAHALTGFSWCWQNLGFRHRRVASIQRAYVRRAEVDLGRKLRIANNDATPWWLRWRTSASENALGNFPFARTAQAIDRAPHLSLGGISSTFALRSQWFSLVSVSGVPGHHA